VDHLVDIRIVDYREVRGSFDRVVSIEMLEAVGHRYLGTYFATIDRLLAPDGLAAIQVITIPEQRYDHYRRRPDFIQRYIFPGGHLPSLQAMTQAMGEDSELFVEEVENIGPHYAETLRRWRERFVANVGEVRALGFDDTVRADVGVLPRLLRGRLPRPLHQRPAGRADAPDERHARRGPLRPPARAGARGRPARPGAARWSRDDAPDHREPAGRRRRRPRAAARPRAAPP
jgi:hypothetical protein